MSTTTTKRATAGDDHAEEEANEREIRRIRQAALKRLATAGVFSARPPGLRDSDGHTFRDETPIDGLCDDCGSSAQFHAEQSSNPDAERIAQLENEGLTHSDAVGFMEAEKLARQPEPAAGEERDQWRVAIRPRGKSHWGLSIITGDCPDDQAGLVADLPGYYRLERNRSDILPETEALARRIVTEHNAHAQLVAALEQAHELLYTGVSDRKALSQPSLYRVLGVVAEALRLAKDGE